MPPRVLPPLGGIENLANDAMVPNHHPWGLQQGPSPEFRFTDRRALVPAGSGGGGGGGGLLLRPDCVGFFFIGFRVRA